MKILITESFDYDERAIKIYEEIGSIFYYNQDFKSKEIECLVVRLNHYIDKNFLTKFESLRYILTPTTALTHLDLNYIFNKKISVLSLRDCKNDLKKITSSAEHALLLTLLICRNIKNFTDHKNLIDWDRYQYEVNQLSSLKIGIIGLGRIGSWLKGVFEKMGIKVLFNDIKENLKHDKNFREKKDIIKESDLLIISCTYNEGDKEIIGFDEINNAKDKLRIVNISRGGVVNEDALCNGIIQNKIKGYATDVLLQEDNDDEISNSKLIKLKKEGYNIIITPHIGGVASEAMRETEFIIAKKFQEILSIKKQSNG